MMSLVYKQIFVTLVLGVAMYLPVSAQCLIFPPVKHSYGIRKATEAKLFMFFQGRTTFANPQGIATIKLKSRDEPSTEDDDDEVVVYGVNSDRHQLIYNTSMWALDMYGSKGSGNEQFLYPKGIAIDEHGNVYVVDSGNNRIVHLFNPKETLRWVKAFNGKSNKESGLNNPSQISLDAKGLLYVTDTGNRRIAVFDSSGQLKYCFPDSSGRFSFENGPIMVTVADGRDKWSYFSEDRFIFCSDREGRRLIKLNLAGQLLDTLTLPNNHSISYGAIDFYHNLWVTDTKRHCILKFSRDLKLLDVFGSYGKQDNQFIEPRGIAIYKRYGQTFIAEKDGAQYFWVGTSVKSVELSHSRAHWYMLNANFTEYSYVSIFAISSVNDTTYFLQKRFMNPGGETLVFASPTLSAYPDKSKLFIRVEPTYSSYSYFWLIYPIKFTKY